MFIQRTNGCAKTCTASEYANVVTSLYEEMATYNADSILRPDYYLCVGGRIIDIDGMNELTQVLMLLDIEISLVVPDEKIIVVCAKNQL